ncbi:hypothetical protein C0J52_03001 [Blattella germanica]|nr:hypothetical protein C0J52_25194 [Blattella germanica]PSN52897.1 hypothetical protein C0J52_03001 [Blattella germanica]
MFSLSLQLQQQIIHYGKQHEDLKDHNLTFLLFETQTIPGLEVEKKKLNGLENISLLFFNLYLKEARLKKT